MHSAVELITYGVAALAFTLAGLAVEFRGVVHFVAGELSVAAWMGVFGLLLLYAGVYMLGYEQVLTRVRTSGN